MGQATHSIDECLAQLAAAAKSGSHDADGCDVESKVWIGVWTPCHARAATGIAWQRSSCAWMNVHVSRAPQLQESIHDVSCVALQGMHRHTLEIRCYDYAGAQFFFQ